MWGGGDHHAMGPAPGTHMVTNGKGWYPVNEQGQPFGMGGYIPPNARPKTTPQQQPIGIAAQPYPGIQYFGPPINTGNTGQLPI